MTMLDTLFGLIPAESRGEQWLAEELQLVNWGGYDGAHRVRFAPSATLLCGGSGSGKSTLMDAYIALMMPHTTPFNGASNGGVGGRARGGEQRNILSYGRGKLDESRTAEGTAQRVLRGDGSDTWTAIAMGWVNHDGARFTAVRAWYIPATARTLDDITKVRAVLPEAFDLAVLETAARQRLTDAAVRATGLETIATDKEFSARLHAVLGIGAAGAGAKAMSLLARIQAGQQITTVDELYKRMVLEEPESLAMADAVVAHFDELEGTRLRMVAAQRQVRALRPIRDYRTRLEAAAERLRLLGQVGSFAEPDSLATLWRSASRLALLRDTETGLQQRKLALDEQLRAQRALAEGAETQRDALAEVLRNAGGDRLETAQRELHQAARRLEQVRENRQRLDVALTQLAERADSERAFTALQQRARQALGDPHAKAAARDAYAEARSELTQLRRRVEELDAEYRATKTRRGNIPAALHESRQRLAEAAGVLPEELPFVGELIEVRTEYEPWREAFNLALGGFATTVLIDVAHLAKFRAAINATRLPQRVRFEGAHTGLPLTDVDPRSLPGRLDYAESPFAGWLQEQLAKRFGLICVDTAQQLAREPKALTITGQLAQGSRGAHGGHGVRNVLGVTSQRRLSELAEEISVTGARLEAAELAGRSAAAELDGLDERLAAYGKIVELSWEQVDVAAMEAELGRWEAVLTEVLGGNPEVARFRTQLDELRTKKRALDEAAGKLQAEVERIEQRWGEIAEEVDAAEAVLDAAEQAGRQVPQEVAAFLEERFVAGQEDPADATAALARFDAALAGAAQRLAEDRDAAQLTVEEQRENLRRTMEGFLDNWPNPNLGCDPETSYRDFERILAELEASGLHELEAEWQASLLRLSGNDLTNLHSTLDRGLREIRDRIAPINEIMRGLPFYDDAHRLQITPRENQSEVRRKFRKELRHVRAVIEQASSEQQRRQAYDRMAKLIGRIRRGSADFAELIDVRNHVRVSAEKVLASTGEHVSLYDHIGEKSGGESQELIAFIVGAALRYQLGDADSERPRYAPVFLDEALIKADAHFTKRAIGAWRGLGFQLVIGAPNDKYSAIEPHVEAEYDILKDTQGRSWAKPKVALPG